MKFNPYSSSKLDVATCGYSFINEYGKKDRVKRESIASARGTAAHEVLERISKELIAGRVAFDRTEVVRWVSEAVTRHPVAYAEINEIIKIADMYVTRPINFNWKDIRTEQNLAVKVEGDLWTGTWDECAYDDPNATIRGRIDLMAVSEDGESAIIYDHKTQFNIETADTFQLGIYAWIVWKTYPFLKNISTVLHFARWGSYSPVFTWSIEDLKNIEYEMFAKIDVIENRQTWEATPHKNCNYCNHIVTCPAVAEFIERDESGNFRVKSDNFKILGDTFKAVKLAGLVRILEEWIDCIKGELKAHVEFAGPVAIPGIVYEFRGEEVPDYDYVTKKLILPFIDICQKHHVDHIKYMSVNATATKGAWRHENEDFVRELSEFFPRKTRTAFKGYKV